MTMWPAFEAVKCAERQSLALADELDWALRVAFFAESRCISFGNADESGRLARDYTRSCSP
jgi:hypothetical protein